MDAAHDMFQSYMLKYYLIHEPRQTFKVNYSEPNTDV